MAESGVPVIDVAPLFSDRATPEEIEAISQQISQASEKWGFYQIINHGLDPEYFATVEKQMKHFFDLPQEAKGRLNRTHQNFRGYFNDEFTKNKMDWKEGFDYSAWPLDLEGDSQWPEDQAEMKKVLVHHFLRTSQVADRLMEVYAALLDRPTDFFKPFFQQDEHASFVRLNHYPVCPDSTSLGVGPHQDGCAITLLFQDTAVSGLQVYIDDAWDEFSSDETKWVTINPVEGALVVNVGTMLEVWSNTRFKAALHRVLANNSKERFSIPLFYLPSMHTDVTPIVPSGQKQIYKTINFGEYRRLLFRSFIEEIPLHLQARLPNYRL